MIAAKLEGTRVVPCDVAEAISTYSVAGAARVALDKVLDATVSTVFLAFGHGLSPLWFETMVFDTSNGGATLDDYTRRYATWDEAVAGHAQVVEEVRRRHALEAPPDGILDPPDGGAPD